MMIDQCLRDRISSAISNALRPLPAVFAGWEGVSAAFGALDAYSDIDLNYLVDDDASPELLYHSAETALKMVSPITARHPAPPGRYYKLSDGGEFLLVDLCFFRAGAVERHGHIVPLFDKGDWLSRKFLDYDALATRRDKRYRDCAVRWDFGMRYLDRDLPPALYDRVRDLTFVRDLQDLEAKVVTATAWGTELLRELDVP